MYTPEHPNYIKVKEVLKWHNTHYRSVMVPNDPLIQDILKKLFIDPIDIREYERKNMDYQAVSYTHLTLPTSDLV